MPIEDRFELSITLKSLLIALLITVVPISLAGLYSAAESQKSLELTIGSHFRLLAESTAAEVSHFIHDRVIGVGALAIEPDVIAAVTASNRSYQGMSDAAVSEKVSNIDKTWNTPHAEPVVRQVLSSPASRLMLRHRERDPRLLRITITDEKGATVAASHKTLDYYQADEEYWQNIYANGRGNVSITAVLYDEVTKSHYVGIGMPILEEGTTRVIGTLDTLVDVSNLFPVVNRLQFGQTARTLLVTDDGTVISAPKINLSMRIKSEEYAALRDSHGTLEGQQTGYLVTDLRGSGRNLIGFADTGLRNDYPRLGWVVLVAQHTSEAFAPIRTVNRLIIFISALALALVVILLAYFTLHRKEVLVDIGEASNPAAESKEEGTEPKGRPYSIES